MSVHSIPVYSPLCDSDYSAYSDYLSAFKLVHYGKSSWVSDFVAWDAGKRAQCGECGAHAAVDGGSVSCFRAGDFTPWMGCERVAQVCKFHEGFTCRGRHFSEERRVDDCEIAASSGGSESVMGVVEDISHDTVRDDGGCVESIGLCGVSWRDGCAGDVDDTDGNQRDTSKCSGDFVDAVNRESKSNCVVGGLDGKRGPNWERNNASRVRRKAKRDAARNNRFDSGYFRGCLDDVKTQVVDSRARRFIAENEEAELKARRRKAVLESSDIESDIKEHRTRVSAKTERNMVSIEKTHAVLTATGNVPGEMGGFAATIVSGSISPDSSVSEKEVRECQKKLLDSEARVDRLVSALRNANVEIPYGPQTQKENEHIDGIWTDNTENRNFIDENYSAYGIVDNWCESGKMRIIPC